MTSIVTVRACCGPDKELVLEVFNPDDIRHVFRKVLQNGEEHTVTIWDNVIATSYERKKQ